MEYYCVVDTNKFVRSIYAVAVGWGAARGPRFAGAERARVQKVSITLLHNLCNCVIAERSFYENKFRKRW